MIKNAILYRIATALPTLEATNLALEAASFVPCAASQEKSVGWIPPRGQEHGALVESVGGQWVLKLMQEVKVVPGSVVKRKVQEQLEQIEATTGRKPGKKEAREIGADVRLSLLPMAFTKQSASLVWIDQESNLLVVDAGSQSRADEVLTWLVKAIDGLALHLVNTQTSPAAAMAYWLSTKESPNSFTVDRECELKAADESKAVVRYGRHALDIDEVAQHIAMGKVPTRLALTWDGRVSFVLTEGLQLKKLTFLDTVFEDAVASTETVKADNFDADVAIATGELGNLIPALLSVLGGELSTQSVGSGLDSKLREDGLTASLEDNQGNVLAHFGEGPDPMYEQAVVVVRSNNKVSISLVQRHLKIGYNRAARLIEDMEKAGLVSPMTASGQRDLLK